jgi:hypothetical protein
MRIFGFGSRHHILELSAIPREKDKLRQALGQARHAKRRSNLMRWAAINLLGWSLIVPFWSQQSGTVTASQPYQTTIYLPIVLKYE